MAMMQSFLNVMGLCSVLVVAPYGGPKDPPTSRSGSVGQSHRQGRKSVRTPLRDRTTQEPAGQSALIRAIISGDKSAFAVALATPGVDVNAKDSGNQTALLHAIDDDRLEFVAALLAAGALINPRDHWSRTALIHAAAPEEDSEEHYGPVKAPRDGRIFEPREVDHHKPSNPRIVAMLIKAGADCSVRDNQGDTPLIHYLRNGVSDSNQEVLDALIRCGVSVNAHGSDGKTALMMAAQETRSLALVAALLKANAEVDARDNHGETALILAAHFGKGPTVITALLKAGADRRAKNRFDQIAYDFARENFSLKESAVLSLLKPAQK